MVRSVCSRVAVMYLGKIVELADNGTVFFNPGHPYTGRCSAPCRRSRNGRYNAAECLLEGEPPSPIDLPPGCSFTRALPARLRPLPHRGAAALSAWGAAVSPPAI